VVTIVNFLTGSGVFNKTSRGVPKEVFMNSPVNEMLES